MDVRAEVARAADRSTRQDFVERYGHPFLAIRIEIEDEDAAFMTMAGGAPGRMEDTPLPRPTTALVGEMLSPVVKRPGANQFSFITIGRASNNDVVVGLASVSKCHAVFNKTATGYTIADAGSKNGTVLNGRKLPAHQPESIASGDIVALSDRVTITFMDAATTYTWLRSIS